MVILLAATAAAAPVVCEREAAARVVAEARIDPSRVPVTHPHLVPGLARATHDPELVDVLDRLCAPGATVDVGLRWQSHGGMASVVQVARADHEDCVLVQRRAAISVGWGPEGATYRLLQHLPEDRTPLPGCPGEATWHERVVVDGGEGPVRLVVQTRREGANVLASSVEVLEAGPTGWARQVLRAPAPPRYLVPGKVDEPRAGGPRFAIGRTRSGEPWVVASGNHQDCVPRGGQVVWRHTGDGWAPTEGREALGLLAREELWRLAGDPGWFLILAQDAESDAKLLRPRLRRLQRRAPGPLHLFRSTAFPSLNPGYLFIALDPWSSRAAAQAARRPGQRGAYVKQAWSPVPVCGAAPDAPG